MITDLNIIRKELEECYEVEMPYNFKSDCRIKYITIKDNKEYFYQGGKFRRMGNNKIILYNVTSAWTVPTNFYDKKGNVIYKTRFFIDKQEDEQYENNNKEKELMSIIKKQQEIIDKLSNKVIELSIKK